MKLGPVYPILQIQEQTTSHSSANGEYLNGQYILYGKETHMSNKAINEHHVDIAITKQFLLLKQGARSSAITHG